MIKLLQDLLKSGEMTISPLRITAKGGLPILLVFIIVVIVLWR